MKHWKRDMFRAFWSSCVLLLFMTIRVHAQYLDPGTGSYLIQLLIAGFLATLFYLKGIRNSLTSYFKNLFVRKYETRHEEDSTA